MKEGSFVHGRTLEFGILVDISLAVVPRGYLFSGTIPDGKGLFYGSKYGAIGAIAFGDPSLMDGLNGKELAVGTFYFPGYAGYSQITLKISQKRCLPLTFRIESSLSSRRLRK